MEMLRWMGRTSAKFVGLLVMLLGAWVFFLNVGHVFLSEEADYGGWLLAWILGSGLAGAVGGLFYLLSFDGPRRFRTTRTRMLAWLGMLGGALVPSMILPFMVLFALLVSPTLFTVPDRAGQTAGSPTGE